MFSPEERQRLLTEIGEGPPGRFMEVCGTHTVAIARSGLKRLLPPGVGLISGPGCPVCVTAQADIDAAISLARRPGLIVATFGDMLRVPGSGGSLAQERARGADVRVLYSPWETLKVAAENPSRPTVFLAVGFETTAPLIAAAVREAERLGLGNLSFLLMHKLLPPVMRVLLEGPVHIDGFLMPGHVCAILGVEPFRFLGERYHLPGVVAGFEPEDVLLSLWMLQRQRREGRAEMEIEYRRVVRPEGNRAAQRVLDEVFRPAPARWRGIGWIDGSGLSLRPPFDRFDARLRFDLPDGDVPEPPGCACGGVLRGSCSPAQCALFSSFCTPDNPVGPCMVSSEGSCAAAYRYERMNA
jgi:hydrogenase expression/formation protein HypD